MSTIEVSTHSKKCKSNFEMNLNPKESLWHWPGHLNIQADTQQLVFLLMLYSIGFQLSGHRGQICQKPVITTQKAKSKRTSLAWSNYRDTSDYISANYLSTAQKNCRRHHYDLQINFNTPELFFVSPSNIRGRPISRITALKLNLFLLWRESGRCCIVQKQQATANQRRVSSPVAMQKSANDPQPLTSVWQAKKKAAPLLLPF